jgi:hypothetical protein
MQMFHDWMLKSWDRILCWYDKLCSLEGDGGSTGGLRGLVDDQKRKKLQV